MSEFSDWARAQTEEEQGDWGSNASIDRDAGEKVAGAQEMVRRVDLFLSRNEHRSILGYEVLDFMRALVADRSNSREEGK